MNTGKSTEWVISATCQADFKRLKTIARCGLQITAGKLGVGNPITLQAKFLSNLSIGTFGDSAVIPCDSWQ